MEHSTYLQSLFAEREAALMAEMQQRAAAADRDIAEANRRAAHAQQQAAHAQQQAQEQAARAQEQAAHAQQQAAHAQQQGQRYGIIEGLIAILALRFDATVVQVLRPTFENVQEVERLKQLLLAARQAPNLEAFLQQLAE